MKKLFILILFFSAFRIQAQKTESMVVLGECSGSCEITVADAKALDSLFILPEIGSNTRIYTFEFTILFATHSFSEGAKNSNKLNPKMKAALSKIKSGDKIFVDLIKIKFPNGKLKNSKGITLRVK